MRDEFVRRRAWIDDATFVDLIGAANLIPGPTSTEVAMHVGHRRAGMPGLFVAGDASRAVQWVVVAAAEGAEAAFAINTDLLKEDLQS